MNESFAHGLIKILIVLKDYLSELVVGGGWAPFLYYRYLVGAKSHQPILTRDIDLLVSANVPAIGTNTID